MCFNIFYGKFFLILCECDVVLRCCFNVFCGIKMWKIYDLDMYVYGKNLDIQEEMIQRGILLNVLNKIKVFFLNIENFEIVNVVN